MRIISGTLKGRQIFPDKNFKARPTTDFAKENLFNVLTNHLDIENASALDLFSGTGSISYEFASRGAGKVISIEANYFHYAFIKRTAASLGLTAITVYKNDVFAACKKLRGQTFDFIFADPPYDLPRITEVPDAIFENGLLAPGGIAVVEHPGTVSYADHPRFFEHRTYGSVNFTLFRQE